MIAGGAEATINELSIGGLYELSGSFCLQRSVPRIDPV